MANDYQHNQIIKVHFDGNKHLKHVLSDEEILNMTMIEGRFPLTKLPVCVGCERLGLWTKDSTGKAIGYCKTCGTYTRKPVTYSTYLAAKMDVDQTGETFRKTALIDRKIDNLNRIFYLPNFDRLEDNV